MAKKNEQNATANYSVVIAECSKELSAKERIAMKDISNATKLDIACTDEKLTITPVAYAILDVHNEKSDNVDYNVYVIIDNEGNKYSTGSESFWNAFMSIYNEMKEEAEAWSIEIYKLDSKNYKGKQFLTCSIV